MTSAKIIKHSVNPEGQEIMSAILRYPRYIHGELMTHRVFSRNSASSRAIPIKKMIGDIQDDPASPTVWGKAQPGMQSFQFIDSNDLGEADYVWNKARDLMIGSVRELDKLQVHKQFANRLIEPWMHITVLVTATDWGNFFNLRAHPDAAPDFQELSFRLLHQYMQSVPQKLDWGEWHIVFEDQMPESVTSTEDKIRIATARAARLSYMTFEGEIDPQKDIALHDSLIANGHLSPTEHCACAEHSRPKMWDDHFKAVLLQHPDVLPEAVAMMEHFVKRDQGNFNGWTQYRKLLQNENQSSFDPKALMARKPNWVTLK